jgi:hypothetical protein
MVVESCAYKLCFQIDAHRIASNQLARSRNQSLRKVGADAPVARFVGIGSVERATLVRKPIMVQLAAHRT